MYLVLKLTDMMIGSWKIVDAMIEKGGSGLHVHIGLIFAEIRTNY